jgi:phospholipase A1
MREPKSGNLDPDYIAPAVDYNNIEAKFQLSFKTKVLQGVFGAW